MRFGSGAEMKDFSKSSSTRCRRCAAVAPPVGKLKVGVGTIVAVSGISWRVHVVDRESNRMPGKKVAAPNVRASTPTKASARMQGLPNRRRQGPRASKAGSRAYGIGWPVFASPVR